MNFQRWRIFRQGGNFHLFSAVQPAIDWIYLDAGIAMARFATCCSLKAIEGHWVRRREPSEEWLQIQCTWRLGNSKTMHSQRHFDSAILILCRISSKGASIAFEVTRKR